MSNWFDTLTERQRRFCEAFASNGGNGTDAARSAGYAKPEVQAAENLKKPNIQAALEALRLSQTSAAIATREERQALWTAILRGEVMERDGEPAALKDRLKASELLGKSQADFIERTRHEGADGKPLSMRVEFVTPEGGT